MIAIRLNRVDGPDENAGTSKMLTPTAFTGADGKFSVGTYEKGPPGDGAPNGKYNITFQWGRFNLMNGRYQGDKFNGKYSDADKSEFMVRVEGGPVEVPPIELSMKDLPEAPTAAPSLSDPGKSEVKAAE